MRAIFFPLQVITFIDLAGHERYLKTTVFGMTGHVPDFSMLMVRSYIPSPGTNPRFPAHHDSSISDRLERRSRWNDQRASRIGIGAQRSGLRRHHQNRYVSAKRTAGQHQTSGQDSQIPGLQEDPSYGSIIRRRRHVRHKLRLAAAVPHLPGFQRDGREPGFSQDVSQSADAEHVVERCRAVGVSN